jgi:hypothetical protein
MVDTRPIGTRAGEWASANHDVMPKTWEELSRYPREYRHAAFLELTPAEKSTLVHDFILNFRRTERLTRDQDALLNAALAIVSSPRAYSADGEEGARQAMKPICDRISKSFDARQRALFGSLGNPSTGEATWRRWARNAKEVFALSRVHARSSAKIETFNVCSCAASTSCSSCGMTGCSPTDCTSTPDGCGCFWLWTCDGTCGIA